MEFGYFRLSDNHHVDDRRGTNEFVADILDEALAEGARLASRQLWG